MKKIFLPIFVILAMSFICSGYAFNSQKPKVNNSISGSVVSNTKENLSKLKKNGFEIIPDQSFWTKLEGFGRVKFISGYTMDMGTPILNFYLVDSNENIIYKLSNFYGNMWIFDEIKAISFRDVNKDGLKDIIVIADYILGHGENAATPFPVAGIYFQKDKNFIDFAKLDESIYDSKNSGSIDKVLKFVENKKINLNSN